jgi:hypothetical protein
MTTCLDLNWIQVLSSARTKSKIIGAANSESSHVLNKSDISILQVTTQQKTVPTEEESCIVLSTY